MARTFLAAEWNNLIMANYEVDAAVLEPYLPNKTELDYYKGKLFVSLVGFMFENTRMLGLRVPFHVNFEEVNLRFYVRFKEGNEWRRGVVFIKEIVPRSAIVVVANTLYREKYVRLPMTSFIRKSGDEMTIGYGWKYKKQWNRIEATTGIKPVAMQAGSEPEFIAEHYWGYSRYSTAVTFEYAVMHPSWEIYPVRSYTIDCAFGALYGDAFAFLGKAAPSSVFVAKGSAVTVMNKRNL